MFVSTKFILSGVTPTEVKKLMKSVDFEDILRQPLKKTQKAPGTAFAATLKGIDGVHSHKKKSGLVDTVISDCHTEDNVKCWHCREREGFRENGYSPLLDEVNCFGSSNNKTKVSQIGFFCDMNCMAGYCKERCYFGHPEYEAMKQSLENGILIYSLTYPGKGELIPAGDWKHLKSNGGCFDYDVWKRESHTFVSLPGFQTCKASCSYIQR